MGDFWVDSILYKVIAVHRTLLCFSPTRGADGSLEERIPGNCLTRCRDFLDTRFEGSLGSITRFTESGVDSIPVPANVF